MGCFDVVCALTNVPIYTEEKCHLVILKKDVDWDYGVTWLTTSEGRWGGDATVFHGTYDDYGSIETDELTEKEEAVLVAFDADRSMKHFFICDTAWQWCQERHALWVPEYIKARREMRAILAESAVTPIKGKNGKIIGKMIEDTHSLNLLSKMTERDVLAEEDQIALARVLRAFTSACKHPLSALGQYHQYQGDEVAEIRENMALTEKRLQEVEKRWAAIDEEYGEDKDEDS